MKPSLFPTGESVLHNMFSEGHLCFAQVATVGAEKCPEVRTVHVKLENNHLLFNTNSDTLKWRHLRENPILAGCFYNQEKRFQLRFKAKTILIDDESSTDLKAVRKNSWHLFLDKFKAIYWSYYKDTYQKEPREDICPVFVTVCLDVYNWDLSWTDELNWIQERRIYELKDSHWAKVYELGKVNE